MRLYICEKPKQCGRIIENLPSQKFSFVSKGTVKSSDGRQSKVGYYQSSDKQACLIACEGHLMSVADPHEYDPKYKKWQLEHLPLFFSDIKIVPIDDPKRKMVFKLIGELLKEATEVVHCGDIDDEGQAIVDNLLRHYKFKGKVYRLWTKNETVPEIGRSLQDLKDNKDYEYMGYRANTRSYSDKLLGYNMTRLYTLLYGGKIGKTLNVGRVQSPILGLVVRREKMVENFVKVPYFYISGKGLVNHIALEPFKIEYEPDPTNLDVVDDKGRLKDKAFANKIVADNNNQTGKITKITKENKSKSPPMPFCANSLQQEAIKELGFTAKEAMDIAQKIKDKDLISYHRTDTRALPDDLWHDVPATLQAIKANGVGGNMWALVDEKKRHKAFTPADSDKTFTHHGIVPLATTMDLNTLSDKERQLYELIVKNYLQLFMKEHTYITHKVEIQGKDNATFTAYFKEVTEQGFLASGNDEDNTDTVAPTTVNDLKEQDSVELKDLTVQEKETEPPQLYTRLTLQKDIANAGRFSLDKKIRDIFIERSKKEEGSFAGGLSTPASCAGIVDSLFKNGFLEEKKKKVVATETGKYLVAILDNRLTFPDLTAIWYIKNQNIKTYDDVVKICQEMVASTIEPICKEQLLNFEASPHGKFKCPKCQGYLLPFQRTSKAGKVYTQWSCDRECGSFFGTNDTPDFEKPLQKQG